MSWARDYIAALQRGEEVKFRPHGNSMVPRIKSGALVTVVPATVDTVCVNDVVLCKVNGRQFLHLVGARRAGQVRIENMRGLVNGWTNCVYGVCVKVEP